MNEQSRQQYLKAMGIQQWTPRRPVPDDQFPSLFNWPAKTLFSSASLSYTGHQPLPVPGTSHQDKGENIPIPPVDTQLPSAARHQPAIVSLNREINGEKIDSANKNEINHNQCLLSKEKHLQKDTPPEDRLCKSETKHSPPATPFRIAAVSVSHSILVVTDILLTDSPELSMDCKKLLHAIILAIGHPCEPVARWQVDTLTWPLPGLRENLTEKGASDAVNGFLSNQFGLHRREMVLLSGSFSTRYCLSDFQDFEHLLGVHIQSTGGKWGATYSLDQILKLPILKKEVWSHLSTLAV